MYYICDSVSRSSNRQLSPRSLPLGYLSVAGHGRYCQLVTLLCFTVERVARLQLRTPILGALHEDLHNTQISLIQCEGFICF